MLKLNKRTVLLFFPVLFLFLFSCEEPSSDIGIGFKLPDQRMNVYNSDTITVTGLVYTMDSIRGDDPVYSLLGERLDPVFGTAKASIVTQLRLSDRFEPGDGAKTDSLFLILLKKDVYGDENSMMHLTVRQSFNTIFLDSTYYSNFNVHDSLGTEILGEVDYLAGDSIIRIALDTSFGNWLISDPDALVSQAAFQSHFKGLYLESENISGGEGGLTILDLLSANSFLAFYYSNNITDSLRFGFEINTQTARISIFEHDYTTADEATKIRHLNDGIQDTVIYAQGMSGVYTKISLPNFETWRDSMPMAINMAEFILELDDTTSIALEANPPANAYDLLLKDENGQFALPIDTQFGEDYSGGSLDTSTVHFRVTQHLQDYLEGKNDLTDFYLYVRSQKTVPNRTIFNSPSNSNKLKFRFIYTRMKE